MIKNILRRLWNAVDVIGWSCFMIFNALVMDPDVFEEFMDAPEDYL